MLCWGKKFRLCVFLLFCMIWKAVSERERERERERATTTKKNCNNKCLRGFVSSESILLSVHTNITNVYVDTFVANAWLFQGHSIFCKALITIIENSYLFFRFFWGISYIVEMCLASKNWIYILHPLSKYPLFHLLFYVCTLDKWETNKARRIGREQKR